MNLKPGIRLWSENLGTGRVVQTGDRATLRLNGWLNQGDVLQTNFDAG